MKMKLFTLASHWKALEPSALEDEINAWLAENPNVEIKKLKQSSNGGSWAGSKVFISIWYEESA